MFLWISIIIKLILQSDKYALVILIRMYVSIPVVCMDILIYIRKTLR